MRYMLAISLAAVFLIALIASFARSSGDALLVDDTPETVTEGAGEAPVAVGDASVRTDTPESEGSRTVVPHSDERGAELRGTIVGTDSGRPYSLPIWLAPAGTTGAAVRRIEVRDASFAASVPAGNYSIESSIPIESQTILLESGRTEWVTVRVMEGNPLTVTVFVDGAIATGAEVWISRPANPTDGAVVGKTGMDGRLSLPGWPSHSWVAARHPSASGIAGERLGLTAGGQKEVVLRLTDGMRGLRLVLEDHEGARAMGARVSLRDQATGLFPIMREADESGIVEFVGVSARVLVSAEAAGLAPARAELEVPIGWTQQKLTLGSGACVMGTVGSAELLTRPRVELRAAGSRWESMVGADGRFRIERVPEGKAFAVLRDDAGVLATATLGLSSGETLHWNPVVAEDTLHNPMIRVSIAGADRDLYSVYLEIPKGETGWTTIQVRDAADQLVFRLPSESGSGRVRLRHKQQAAITALDRAFDWGGGDLHLALDVGDIDWGKLAARLPYITSIDGVSVIMNRPSGEGVALVWSAVDGSWLSEEVPTGPYVVVVRGDRVVPNSNGTVVHVEGEDVTRVVLSDWKSCGIVSVAEDMRPVRDAWIGTADSWRAMTKRDNRVWARLDGTDFCWAVVLDSHGAMHWYLLAPGSGDVTLGQRAIPAAARPPGNGRWACQVISAAGVMGKLEVSDTTGVSEVVAPAGAIVEWTPLK